MRTTYILGAGASVASNAPTVADFPEAARRALGRHMTKAEGRRFEKTLVAWEASRMTIEEYYVLCETAEAARLGSHLGTVSSRDVQWLIAKTLQEALRNNEGSAGRAAYKQFIYDAAGRNAVQAGCSVVSLNWDTCVETAARDVGGAVHIPVRKQSALDKQAAEIPVFLWDVLPFVKLHGSMNWWYCQRCKTMLTSGVDKGIVQDLVGARLRTCPTCQRVALPAMVPPTSAKLDPRSPLHPLLSQLWALGASGIAGARRLVVIGYSFPDADLQFRLMVRAALAKSQAEVVIVTRAQTNPLACRRAFARKLGVPVARMSLYDKGFATWVKRRGRGYPPRNDYIPLRTFAKIVMSKGFLPTPSKSRARRSKR